VYSHSRCAKSHYTTDYCLRLLLHLIYVDGLVYDATIISDYIPSSNVRTINKWWIRRNYTIQALETYSTYYPAVFVEEIHGKPQSRGPVSQYRFESNTAGMQVEGVIATAISLFFQTEKEPFCCQIICMSPSFWETTPNVYLFRVCCHVAVSNCLYPRTVGAGECISPFLRRLQCPCFINAWYCSYHFTNFTHSLSMCLSGN
jgi:hypothetical protein